VHAQLILKPNSTNILVVDDEQAHTILLAELLKKAGYGVDTANDGFKALAACRVRTPDLIILDLHMPLMGGIEVLNRLRADEKTRGIPLIFIGNKNETSPKVITEDATDEDILLKPFEPNELLSRIKSTLKQKALVDQLREKEGQLKELAIGDPLSSLKTARFLSEFLVTTIRQSRRYRVPFSLIVAEVDKKEDLIDRLGQKASDELLGQVADHLSKQLRDSDIVAKSGVFELTMVLTVTDNNGAIEVAERLRNQIKEKTFVVEGQNIAVTISLGICQYSEKMDNEGKIILSHAYAALTQARANGGDVTLMAE
jgi:diguanylate cyclase (GGDEF)-like protein